MKFFGMFFDFVWDLFSIQWPGLPFTFGQAFLAAALSSGVLAIVLKLFGFSLPRINSSSFSGGNNRNIRVSEERKGDEK